MHFQYLVTRQNKDQQMVSAINMSYVTLGNCKRIHKANWEIEPFQPQFSTIDEHDLVLIVFFCS